MNASQLLLQPSLPSPLLSPSAATETVYEYHLLGFTAVTVFIISIAGTFGNLLAAVALLQSQKLRQSPSTAFMINLPACLLPVCGVGLPMFGVGCVQMQYYHDVLIPDRVIVVAFTLALMLSQVHIHTICALAFNRLLAVVWPAVYKQLMQMRWARLYLTMLWIYSALLWLPLAFGVFGRLDFEEKDLIVSMSGPRLRKGIHVFFTFMLPIIFTGICYITMYIKMRHSKQSREVRRRRKSVTEDTTLKQWDEQVTRTILIIFVVLVSCSVPHMIIHILHLSDHYPAAWLLLHVVFWLQFCLDPVVYLATSQQYRGAARECLKRYVCTYFKARDAHSISHTHQITQFTYSSHTKPNIHLPHISHSQEHAPLNPYTQARAKVHFSTEDKTPMKT